MESLEGRLASLDLIEIMKDDKATRAEATVPSLFLRTDPYVNTYSFIFRKNTYKMLYVIFEPTTEILYVILRSIRKVSNQYVQST